MVVIRDALRELGEHAVDAAEISAGHVVAAERVMKRFRDAIRFATAHRRGDRGESEVLQRDDGLERGVDAAAITEPLNRVWRPLHAKAMPYCLGGEATEICAGEGIRRGDPRETLPIAAVVGTRNLDEFAVPPREADRIAQPALVGARPLHELRVRCLKNVAGALTELSQSCNSKEADRIAQPALVGARPLHELRVRCLKNVAGALTEFSQSCKSKTDCK